MRRAVSENKRFFFPNKRNANLPGANCAKRCINCVFCRINRAPPVAEYPTFEKNKNAALFRFYLLLLFFFLHYCGQTQTGSPFVFTRYSSTGGLASNEIYGVQQDRDGYLWIATNNGLQRYDGNKYKTFRHDDAVPASLPSNVIPRMLLDKNDVLWLGTSKGEFGTFDKKRFVFQPVSVKARKPDALLGLETILQEDNEGHVFLLVRGSELLLYDKVKKEFSHSADFIPLPESWGIASMVQEPATRKYWIGIFGGGLAIYNPLTGHLNYRGHNPDGEPAIEPISQKREFTYPFFDAQGRLWFENWGEGFPYLLQYDARRTGEPLKQFQFITRLKHYHELRRIMQQHNGRIWVRGHKLLGYFDEKLNDFILIPNAAGAEQGITYEEVSNLSEDREANLWAGTSTHGMYRFNPDAQVFTNILHPSRNLVGEMGAGTPMSFAELKNGNVLVGTWEDATFQYNNAFVQQSLPPHLSEAFKGAYFWSMYPSADSNTIWMSAQPGLWQYDQAAQTARFRNPPILQNRTVRQVVEDKTGTLWLGMHGTGVYRWLHPLNKGGDSLIKVDGVGNSMINKLVVDSKGLVWIATGDNGLFVYDPLTLRQVQHFDGLKATQELQSHSGVAGVLEYSDSVMLAADISNVYLYNRNTGQFRIKPLPLNLLGYVASLQKDNDGYVWVATTNALYRIHPYQNSVSSFDKTDGMISDRFALSSSYKMRDGRLLFGNAVSFIVFDPRRAAVDTGHVKVFITGIQTGKQDLRTDSVMALDRLQIGDKDNSITVDFSLLRYNNQYSIQYRMDNIDTEWKAADGTARVNYPFLPAGHYTLRFRVFTVEGKPAGVTELHIQVKPPWYQTWWFYTLVAMAFVVELWWLDRQRSKRKEIMQKVRTDIAANLHEEINTALNNINILSEIARLKSDREPQKAKDYLEQIHSKSHNMIIALDDMLWSLNPENDAMDKTISRIREFADSMMQRHNVLIELLIDKKVEKMQLNMKLRHEAFLLFKEGLRSLVEAGTHHCIVHLTTERTRLLFTIEFTTEGCDMQKLNNLLQRHDMGQRIQALKAKLDVQLHKSRGLFLLQLPLV